MAGTGYIRQRAADIQDLQRIEAFHFNDEYNVIEQAFDGATGHCHDGSTGNGQPIPLDTGTVGTLQNSKLPANISVTTLNASDGITTRQNLGLEIGVDVQAWGATLDAFNANPLTAAELQQLQNIDTTTISIAQWGFLGSMDQGVATTDDVTFSNATISGDLIVEGSINQQVIGTVGNLTTQEINQLENIDNETISNAQWAFLGNTDQALATTDSVTFNSVTVGGSTPTNSQWANVAAMDQDVATTSTVTFGSVTVGGSTPSNSQWANLAAMDQNVATTSSVTFNSVTVGGFTPTSIQWGYFAGMDQPVASVNNVQFNDLTLTGTALLSGPPMATNEAATKGYVDGLVDQIVFINSGLSPYAAQNNELILVDTSAPVTVTLPASPTDKDKISVIDRTGEANTNNILIERNGKTIAGIAEDLEIDLAREGADLVYNAADGDWSVRK